MLWSCNGSYVKEHIYSEGISDSVKSFVIKIFGKTRTTKKAASKAAFKEVSKVSEHVGKKAGDKIVQLLQKKEKRQDG